LAADHVVDGFAGSLVDADDRHDFALEINVDDYALPNAKVLLGFHVRAAAGSTLDPAAAIVTAGAQGAVVTAAAAATKGTPANTSGDTWRFPVSGLVTGTLNVSLAPDAMPTRDRADFATAA
jgi:hypothetical protein